MVSQRDVLTTQVLHWRTFSQLASDDELAEYLDCPVGDIQRITASDEYKERAIEKGLPSPDRTKLSARQIQAITVLLNPVDGRSFAQKLHEAEIDPDTYANWMKQPEFRKAMTTIGNGNVQDAVPAIMNKLLEKAISGNQRSIEYLFEMQGIYRKQNDEVNPMVLMGQMIELLSKRLGDQPEVLLAISEDLDRTIIKGELGS